MSYQVLARKWRPRSFDTLVGQEHVVRALTHALEQRRLHHAYLFTGTRGVGKTTIARILAKALNCETGITAAPCGLCGSCLEIDAGRFVDLIEVDAATNTRVDEMRQLLENATYAPTRGRFKVYVIDEVHMLSTSAFNAMLKTLEEPPEHIKFILATTDPQKIPVTVLSRCLQFNLKRLSVAQIAGRMERICAAEGLPADGGALVRLARAAAGSMRDGLSLLDQALAFGNGRLAEADVIEMLGSVDRSRVLALLQALCGGDGSTLLARIREVDELVPDYGGLLDDIAATLQQIAVMQVAGMGPVDEEETDTAALQALAGGMDPEVTQLHYQIAILGRRDLGLAPEPRLGFEMTLLRMLAFHPAQMPGAMPATGAPRPAGSAGRPRPAVAAVAPATAVTTPGVVLEDAGDWPAFVQSLPLEGAARQLAMHTGFLGRTPFELRLGIDRTGSHLLTDQLKGRLSTAISERLGAAVTLRFETRETAADTPAARSGLAQEEAVQRARRAIEADPNVRALGDELGAELVPASIRPVGRGAGNDQ